MSVPAAVGPSAAIRPPSGIPLWVVWAALPVQVVLSGAVLFFVGIAISLFSTQYDGLISIIGDCLWSALGAAVATILAVVIGLPLRLVASARRWWLSHGWITWAIAAIGCGVIVLSYLVGIAGWIHLPPTDGNPAVDLYEPDWRVLTIGLILLALGCTHVWWQTPRAQESDA